MEDLVSVFIMLLSGYAIRYALIFSGQMWAKSFAQTVSFFILPIKRGPRAPNPSP